MRKSIMWLLMSRCKYVLWDWNGTLLDDLQANIDVGDRLLEKRGLPPIQSKEFYLENFCFPVLNFYKLIGIDLNDEEYRMIATEYEQEYEQRLKDTFLFDDVTKTLDRLNASGFHQVIISATHEDTLLRQVARYGIEDKFERILGTANNLGISKVQSALSWIEQNGINANETVFIGDTTHDFETASARDYKCMLVARGHNSKRRLIETGCEVFDNLNEVAGDLIRL